MLECSFTDCDRPVRTKGLCNAHYQQSWKGQKLKPLQNWGEVACTFPECGKKAVNKGLCNGHIKQQQRGVSLRPLDGTRAVVKPLVEKELEFTQCGREGCTQPKTPRTLFCYGHNHQRAVYKLTVEQMLSFPSQCEVCGNVAKIHVDHDHTCCPSKQTCGACVRGFLCQPCNMALGSVRDNPDTLQSLINYLQRHQGKSLGQI